MQCIPAGRIWLFSRCGSIGAVFVGAIINRPRVLMYAQDDVLHPYCEARHLAALQRLRRIHETDAGGKAMRCNKTCRNNNDNSS